MKKRGVTLLLAIFISTLATSLGLGIFAIIFGELGISGVAKESLVALYAADSGAECAIYWDIKQQAFSTTTSSSINCAGSDFTVGGSPLSIFDLTLPNDSCAHIQVQKSDGGTTVTSLGSNNSCDSASPSRTVQRGLEVTY
ncbi:hypothetical protein A2926_00560 [Candidatus Giovannonibacteria bacterium RIFCSPLOWO2_01_FULL_44_40]|uniref:Uncharacterized protein n=1 Tax=Candidatus Giovannonibacteria bacterium RIFCSPHIGHO2_01_FULL_45_23 TaxID=1798325 RepID=A0A1F5VFD6_9BACT|nr:MAG: hypothetical protein A2834_00575 [Candidatus Giovannonibacteria bacterium RIFCSPHIGHO2_01_FULL_45_23]OGF76537.1 MAG: hypothetical protein A3C77_03285 [Candidatus Giovannonibacteria bacterium RIFCSPHIGHO2_02_FULL_45_13]OGF79803.1 MAG: hypothetical protein A2926_00560 [Candidatus Giovannonibacteria bacterium RIFCSPLOWO2_01_FULL_44_40]